jgi:hypothetical protein
LGDPDKDAAISCSSGFVARLYDQKKSFAPSHHNTKKLRVKLATSRSGMRHEEYADEAPLLKVVI